MGKEISNKFDLIKCLPDVIKILTSYDVVWSFHPIANLASRIARMLGAVTIVNELRCLKENIKPMGRFLDNQTICKADVLIANSLGVKDSYGIDRIKVLYGGIKASCVTKKTFTPSGIIRVGMVGRVVEMKGIDEICSLFNDVKDFELHIYGEGPLKHSLEESYLRVVFHGHKRKEDIYQAIDVLINNSSSEGMSKSVLEAIDFGVPVLLRNVPSNSEIFDSNYPLYFDCVDEIPELLFALQKSGMNRVEPVINLYVDDRMKKLELILNEI